MCKREANQKLVSLQNKALDQLYINHMGIEQTRLLAHGSKYWMNINAKIEITIKIVPYFLIFQAIQPKDKIMSHAIPGRPWEFFRTDSF